MTRLIGDKFGSAEDIGVDVPNWDLGEIAGGQITAYDATTVTITANSHTYVLHGHGFSFATSDTVSLVGGTITGLEAFPEPAGASPNPEFALSLFSMRVAAFNAFIGTDDVAGFKHALLSQNDHMKGGGGIDHLTGMAGKDGLAGGSSNDILDGGRGDDTLQGDRGADYLIGGKGEDKFVFNGAHDSGGGVYDTIARFDAGTDIIRAPEKITGIDAQVDAGASDSFNVDPVLGAALDADHLGALHAVIATVDVTIDHTPTVTETFLVIDVNGVAGYQAGEDIAVLIANPKGLDLLTADDFQGTFH